MKKCECSCSDITNTAMAHQDYSSLVWVHLNNTSTRSVPSQHLLAWWVEDQALRSEKKTAWEQNVLYSYALKWTLLHQHKLTQYFPNRKKKSFRHILQVLHIWFSSIFCIFQPFPTDTVCINFPLRKIKGLIYNCYQRCNKHLLMLKKATWCI